MWCESCQHETSEKNCELCGNITEPVTPIDTYWCKECEIPVIIKRSSNNHKCPLCGSEIKKLVKDIRPVFPEERLLVEILLEKPMKYANCSVWAYNNRYYINGKSIEITSSYYKKFNPEYIISQLEKYKEINTYDKFDLIIERFVKANAVHLQEIIEEAHTFIKQEATNYPIENIVLSFSGGKDSTVTADLAVKALAEPKLVHIFGNTTLEFPLTIEYAQRFRADNPLSIFRTAINREQNFYNVCEDIGPPARMMRWCCSMFKTGPITRVLNRYYRDISILFNIAVIRICTIARLIIDVIHPVLDLAILKDTFTAEVSECFELFQGSRDFGNTIGHDCSQPSDREVPVICHRHQRDIRTSLGTAHSSVSQNHIADDRKIACQFLFELRHSIFLLK